MMILIYYCKYLYIKFFGSKEEKERQIALCHIYDEFTKQNLIEERNKFFKR